MTSGSPDTRCCEKEGQVQTVMCECGCKCHIPKGHCKSCFDNIGYDTALGCYKTNCPCHNAIPAALEKQNYLNSLSPEEMADEMELHENATITVSKPLPECNCATARGIECPVHGRMWREKEVAGWMTRFEKFDYFFKLMDLKSPGDGTLGQEQIKSFIAKEIEAAETRGRNGAVDYIEDHDLDWEKKHFAQKAGKSIIEVLYEDLEAARQIPGV